MGPKCWQTVLWLFKTNGRNEQPEASKPREAKIESTHGESEAGLENVSTWFLEALYSEDVTWNPSYNSLS